MADYVGIIYNVPDGEIRSIVVPDTNEQLDNWQIDDPNCGLYKMPAEIYLACNGIDEIRAAFAEALK